MRPSESGALQTEAIDRLAPSYGGNNNDEDEPMTIPTSLELRRHSSQDDRPCEIFQQQITNHKQHRSPSPSRLAAHFLPTQKTHSNNRLFNRSALNWLKNFNLMRLHPSPSETSPFMQQLHRCSSENILLLSPEHRMHDLSGTPTMRKSFSSGILF